MDYTKQTLGELLTHTNETIKRNAMSILKTLTKISDKEYKEYKEYQKQIHCYHKRYVMGHCVDCNTKI